MFQLMRLGTSGLGGVAAGGLTPDALLTEAEEEIVTEAGEVIIHEDTEP